MWEIQNQDNVSLYSGEGRAWPSVMARGKDKPNVAPSLPFSHTYNTSSKQIHQRSNDLYDVHDPVTPTPSQRQQQQPLRRTHIEAASAGISPSPSPPRVRFARQQQRSELTHDFEEEPASSTPLASSSQHISPEAARRPHRALRISKNTASAILYTLEEALRHPNPFTPDLVEENASMSDLIGGGPSASAENGRTGNGRIQAPSGTTGSPNIRGPRDIMRDRAARERRRAEEAAEQEALERRRAEEEARLIEQEERRQSAERRAAAAGAAQRGSGEGGNQRGSGGTTGQRISDNSQRSGRAGSRVTSGERPQETLQGVGRGGSAVGGGEAAPSARPRPSTQAQQQPRPSQPEASRTRPAQAQAGSSVPGPSTETPVPPENSGAAPTRSSFPHAFERWETLSAHWEGLTSFWIRRLEENSNEINRDPLSQQLSRQVTDLSAAGANLFHAVVELQRLRASSERKFQRWFFETRAEQERSQEIQAVTEATIQQERRDRETLIAEGIERERQKSNVDKQLAEMKRELQISKEEARRAWEELGRREQEERDRTASLREGQPTLVGGVQVVPMMQGVPSRHGSARDQPQTREGPYATETNIGSQPVQEPEGPVDSDTAYQAYARGQRADPTDPFVEMQQTTPTARTARTTATATSPNYASGYSEAPAVQPASTSGFYQQQQDISLLPADPTSRAEHNPSYGPSVASEGAFSEEEYEIDAQGQFIRDARGNKVRYQAPISDDEEDEYDVRAAQERELAYAQQYGRAPVSGVEYGRGSTATAGRPAAPTSHPATTGVDYEGQGYGAGWEAMPRHHHPTRLSDVLEEDERSRTSASQVSRRE
ncbi:hypothetical protein D0Z07_3142 [Hyphodiscus hymeniophilus]|uniref:Uncharacterized protein n=1 Tax=Hyphodiscus hymeniophilus TaxID=353542 RepID=A0A9P6VM73_9HELO|nr:hypothetical protein D0Z07_3142 [Hyphodiscus hymeniophilus]